MSVVNRTNKDVGGHKLIDNTLNRFNTGIQTSAQSERNLFRNNSISYFTAAYEDLNGSNIFERNRTRQITP